MPPEGTATPGGVGFGHDLVFGPDHVVVGAISHDVGEVSNAGGIAIFNHEDGDWKRSLWIDAPDPESLAGFGMSITLDGHRFMVGAPFFNTVSPYDSGIFYEYQYDPVSGHAELIREYLRPEPYTRGFGISMAADNGWLAVGALSGDGPTEEGKAPGGAVFLYTRNLETQEWALRDKINAPDLQEHPLGGDLFGNLIFLNYPWLAVRAPRAVVEGCDECRGAAYLFRHDETQGEWVFRQKLTDVPPSEVFPAMTTIVAGGMALSDELFLWATSLYQPDDTTDHWPTRRLNIYQLDEQGDQWEHIQTLTHPVDREETIDRFAFDSIIHGGRIYAGDPSVDLQMPDAEPTGGGVWVYAFDPEHEGDAPWQLVNLFHPPYPPTPPHIDGGGTHGFGTRLASAGDRLAVRAGSMKLYGHRGMGAVWLYGEDPPRVRLSLSDGGLIGGTQQTSRAFTRRIRIDNDAEVDATNVMVHIEVPRSFDLYGGNVPCWTNTPMAGSTAGNSQNCRIERIGAGEHFLLDFTASASRAGNYEFAVTALADQWDETPDNRGMSLDITVTHPPSGTTPGGGGSSSGCSSGRGPWEVIVLLLLAVGLRGLPADRTTRRRHAGAVPSRGVTGRHSSI
jgi:hypothetical protein